VREVLASSDLGRGLSVQMASTESMSLLRSRATLGRVLPSVRDIVPQNRFELVKSLLFARAGGLSIAALLVLSSAQAAQADTFVGGTNVWSMVGSPSFPTTGIIPSASVTYSNNLGAAVAGIVIMVLRNNSSQTVYYSTGTMTLSSGGLGSVQLLEGGLPLGTYNATFFAFTFGGVAISAPTSALFTLPGPR